MDPPAAIVSLLLLSIVFGQGQTFPDSFERSKWLDTLKESYLLRWSVSPDDQEVYFRVEVSTRGYVGFGLSHHGSMSQADIVIGGVYPDGSTYFSDRHGPDSSNGYPPEDDHQDWWLEYASENETHTTLGFWRKMKTCDPEDIDMTLQGTVRVIYAWSEDDPEDGVPQYHGAENRGGNNMHLTAMDTKPQSLDEAKHWDMRYNASIPDTESVNLCKVFRGPEVRGKYHVIGSEPLLPSDNADLVHHANLCLCNFPNTWVGQKYEEMDTVACATAQFFCKTAITGYLPGQEGRYLPSNVGFPLQPGGSQYFSIQLHINNPQLKSGRNNFGFRVHYTDHLRPNDASTVFMGYQGPWYNLGLPTPPGQKDWVITGHCHHQCTEKGLREPVKVFGVLLHTHPLGRTVKIRHFRNGTELPWIAVDEHYDFYAQDFVSLPSEVEVMPGDHLTLECTVDSTGQNATVLTGPNTEQVMCTAVILYYPAQPMTVCISYHEPDDLLNVLGISSLKRGDTQQSKQSAIKEFLATADSQNWTSQNTAEIQHRIRYGKQRPACLQQSLFPVIPITDDATSYPNITEEYTPPDTCRSTQSASVSSSTILVMHPNNIIMVVCLTFLVIRAL